MRLPEDFIPTLEKLARRLCQLLPEGARPTSIEGQITEAQMSQDEETHRVQRFYNMTWLILNKILPGIEQISSTEELKEYLFSKTPLIREQWVHISLDRIARAAEKPIDITSKPPGLIPQNQLEMNNINTLFMQLAYNLFYIFEIEIPQQKVCKSSEELVWLYLNKSQSTVEQLKLPVFNYIASFLPEEAEKPIPDKIIVDEKLSPSLKVQFFQRLHNIVCVVANEIFPKLQGKCHSEDDLMSHLVNPSLKKIGHQQAIPLLETTIDIFMDNLYQLLPEKNRPKKIGKIITNKQISQEPFKADTNLRFIASLYNVGYQIKKSVLPRVKKIDSIAFNLIGKIKLIKIGHDFLDDIQPLLENLQPILDQLKVIFINDLYTQLTDEQRPSQCGKLISDDKLSKTDPYIFLIQKCYNLACFLLNKLIPKIKKCWISTEIMIPFNQQKENLIKHFKFIVDLDIIGSINLPAAEPDTTDLTKVSEADSDESFIKVETSTRLKITKDESLKAFKKITQPFLDRIEKFLADVSQPIVLPLLSFFTLLLKETTLFTSLSFTLKDSVNSPLVTENLSYYAGSYIYEAMEALINSLNTLNESLEKEASKNKDKLLELEKKQKNIEIIRSYLMSRYRLANFYFGNHNHFSNSNSTKKSEAIPFIFDQSSSLATAKAKQIAVELDKLTDEWKNLEKEIQKFSNNPNQKPVFIAKVVKEFVEINSLLILQKKDLKKALRELTTSIECENKDIVSSALSDIKKKQQDFQEKIKALSIHLNTLPQTKFIYCSEKREFQFNDYFRFQNLLKSYEEKSEKFDKLIKTKAETIKQLEANEDYIKTAYENLLKSVIQPAEDFLLIEEPNAYEFNYHNQAYQLLAALKKQSFSELTSSSLPHPNVEPKEFQQKIDNAHENFETKLQKPIQNLEQALATQKIYFNQYLKDTISQKLVVLTKEMSEKKESLINAFNDIEKESGEITYNKTLKDAKDWIAKITIEQLIANALVPLKLSNTDLVKQWANEFSRVEHQSLSSLIEPLKTPLAQIIATQTIALNTNNQKAIERLEKQIKDYQTELERASKIVTNIEILKRGQQQEKENLQKSCQALSESMQEKIKNVNELAAKLQLTPIPLAENIDNIHLAIEPLLNENKQKLLSPGLVVLTEFITDKNEFAPLSNRKILTELQRQIQDAKTITDIEKISCRILNLVNEIDQRIGSNLKELIASIKEESFNENKKNAALFGVKLALIGVSTEENLHELKLNSYSKLAESAASELNTANALNELLKALQEILKKDNNAANMSKELSKKHETLLKTEYQKLYADIPAEKWPLSTEIHISTLQTTQQLKKLQLELAKIKMDFNDNHIALKKVSSSLKEMLVPNGVFSQAGILTHEKWKDHHQTSTQKLREIQTKYQEDKNLFSYKQLHFKYFIQQTQKLGDQIKLLEQTASSEANVLANALLSLQENIRKQGELLNKKYTKITKKFDEQKQKLQKAQQTLVEENQQAQGFNQILIAVGQIKGQVNLTLRQVKTRSHPIASKILDGTQKNPSSILAEDQFYENTNQSIANLTNQLEELEKNKIQKETPLSALENAFNQALAEKIAQANTAINSYQAKKQAWETYSTEDLLLQRSRQIANAPKKVSDTLRNCEGHWLERIELANKDFCNVAMRYAYFSHAKLRNCIFSQALKGVNFNNADISTCNFDRANFEGIQLNIKTQLNWKIYGYDILRDNLANPHIYTNQTESYLPALITLIHKKCEQGIPAKWILNLLEEIGAAKKPEQMDEKTHLQAQQQRAVFFIKQIVPQLSLEAVLALSDLVVKKNKDDKNPYGFIRRELDWFNFLHGFREKYGNTQPWQEIMICIKTKLQNLANDVQLTDQQYKEGIRIMKAHVSHDYGFWFFYTPKIAHQWETKHKSNLKMRQV